MATKKSGKDDTSKAKGGAAKKGQKAPAKAMASAQPKAAASAKTPTPPKSAASTKISAKSKPTTKIEADILDIMKSGTTPRPHTTDLIRAKLKTVSKKTVSRAVVNDALESLAARGTIAKSFALTDSGAGSGIPVPLKSAILLVLCPPPSSGGGWSQSDINTKVAAFLQRPETPDLDLAISDELEILSRPGGEIQEIGGLFSRDCSRAIS